MKRIVTIVGARPQFIKAAVLSRLIRSDEWNGKFHETIIHTGQHYDINMSEVFFNDMKIPEPEIHLNIGGGTHGEMTGKMLIQIETELLRLKPDLVVVYGDTNSTLAGALAASKSHIPVAHIEAGLRSFFKKMPEEQNRVLTDHLSEWLFCPTDISIQNLAKEGITQGVHIVGDIMLDASLFYRRILKDEEVLGISRLINIKGLPTEVLNGSFALATVHRAENTDDPEKLANIVGAFNELGTNIILPLHPRTRKYVSEAGLVFNSNVLVIDPIGYFEMLELEMNCKCIITDSGGIQKEAYFLQKPCITLREQTEWVETVDNGWNTLVGSDKIKIINAFSLMKSGIKETLNLYGKGKTGQNILTIINNTI
jgi:UDP-GlcNAc3NAcA epimerase